MREGGEEGESGQVLPVERVEVVVLEPHDEHGVVLLTDGAGVAGQLDTAPGHSVHHHCGVCLEDSQRLRGYQCHSVTVSQCLHTLSNVTLS